jgi:hypothetical protein
MINIEKLAKKAKTKIMRKMGINEIEADDVSNHDNLQNILKQNSAALEKLTEEVNMLKTKLVKAQASL